MAQKFWLFLESFSSSGIAQNLYRDNTLSDGLTRSPGRLTGYADRFVLLKVSLCGRFYANGDFIRYCIGV